jgi:hypothetical protein
MGRVAMPLIRILGVEGKRINILPTTKGLCFTELYNPKESLSKGYMGAICWDNKWKKFVLVDLDKEHQMSRDCINEAFEIVEKYWNKKVKK